MKIARLSLLIACFYSAHVAANDMQRMSECFRLTGEKYEIHPYLLWAIAKTESSFNTKAVGKNTNASVDIGLMQINSTWLPKLRTFQIERYHLFDPCVSIEVGAWVLKDNFNRMGYNWKAVGAYNAKTDWKRDVYAEKVKKNVKFAFDRAGISDQRGLVLRPFIVDRRPVSSYGRAEQTQQVASSGRELRVVSEQ